MKQKFLQVSESNDSNSIIVFIFLIKKIHLEKSCKNNAENSYICST